MGEEVKIISETLKKLYQPNNSSDEANNVTAKKILQNLHSAGYRIIPSYTSNHCTDLIEKIKHVGTLKKMSGSVDDYLSEFRTEKELETFFEALLEL